MGWSQVVPKLFFFYFKTQLLDSNVRWGSIEFHVFGYHRNTLSKSSEDWILLKGGIYMISTCLRILERPSLHTLWVMVNKLEMQSSVKIILRASTTAASVAPCPLSLLFCCIRRILTAYPPYEATEDSPHRTLLQKTILQQELQITGNTYHLGTTWIREKHISAI